MIAANLSIDPTHTGKPEVEIGQPQRVWSRAPVDDDAAHRPKHGHSGCPLLSA